ncbi:hypothetical protein Aph01nite_33600 [Acrocarpospora phusangensis]|uniref:TauD/TfdA-like domain-containing protein n=1 Tax=Acrocarpospora phusangensis TaxID=1070424 RepID=A0A919QCW3_9ACTN|nr:TauD/TfdA family dioxygenase [Acrocarpospora phusangensis]GIH25050.1 hypothetical protein Aph01nite_33600 [Acrocarpospora phusangensis]
MDSHTTSLGAARQRLATQGWTVLPGAGFTDGHQIDHAAVTTIAELFGSPSSRDGGRAVWPVQPATTDPGETFSRRDGEALLHTDAAYRADPEPLFALFCVRPARDGGLSRLLHAADAVAGLDDGILGALRRPQWRWVPPRVFGGERDTPRPVLEPDGAIRWRFDNLDVGSELADVATAFRDHVETHPRLVQLPLATDSVLICDNRSMLHGRTTFADPGRLLLRVRLVTR